MLNLCPQCPKQCTRVSSADDGGVFVAQANLDTRRRTIIISCIVGGVGAAASLLLLAICFIRRSRHARHAGQQSDRRESQNPFIAPFTQQRPGSGSILTEPLIHDTENPRCPSEPSSITMHGTEQDDDGTVGDSVDPPTIAEPPHPSTRHGARPKRKARARR